MTLLWAVSHVALWILALLLTLVCIGLARAVRGFQDAQGVAEVGGLSPGNTAPALPLRELNSENLETLPTVGRRTLLTFVSTACAECHQVVPVLNQLHEQQRGRLDLALVVGAEVEATRRFAAETRPAMRVFGDEGQRLADRYEVPSVPFAVLVGADGLIEATAQLSSRSAAATLLPMVEGNDNDVAGGGARALPLVATSALSPQETVVKPVEVQR